MSSNEAAAATAADAIALAAVANATRSRDLEPCSSETPMKARTKPSGRPSPTSS